MALVRPGFFAPPRAANTAQPETEEDYLAALLELENQPQAPDPQFSGGATPGFLERFGTALQGQELPRGGNFLESFFSGAAGGLASQGQKQAVQRQQFEATMEARRRQRDQENLEATREKRRTLLAGLNENRAETRRIERETRERADKFVTVTAADVKAIPGLARFQGQEVPRDWVKPDGAGSGKADLVEVTNPDGSKVLVPKTPGLQTAPKGSKPPTELQAKASFFGSRAFEAANAAEKDGLEGRILKKALGLNNPNFLQDDEQREYTSAIQAFTLALNRLESGANVTPTEFSRVAQLYFVQGGDKEGDAKRKAALRRKIIDDLEKLQAPGAEGFGPAPNPRAAPAGNPPPWQRVG